MAYRTDSVYRNTKTINNQYLDILNIDNIDIDNTTTETITLAAQYDEKPDLLAHDLYGNAKLWWAFALFNQDKLVDPIIDFKAGLNYSSNKVLINMANLADRNNNPGNIRYNPRIDWQGQGDPNAGFATLATPEHGVRAMSKNLYTYNERDGLNTVGGIISKWAPPSENDTQAYINKVSNDLGVGQNDDLGVLKDDPELTAKLVVGA